MDINEIRGFTWYDGGHPEMRFELGQPDRRVLGIPLWLIDDRGFKAAEERRLESMDPAPSLLEQTGLVFIEQEVETLADWYALRNGLWMLRAVFKLRDWYWAAMRSLYRHHAFPAMESRHPGLRPPRTLALWRMFRPWRLR